MSNDQHDLAQRIATDINGHGANVVSRVRIVGIVHAALAADPTLKAVREALAHAYDASLVHIPRGDNKVRKALAALDALLGGGK